MPKSTGSVSGAHFRKIATTWCVFATICLDRSDFSETGYAPKVLAWWFCALNNVKAVHGAKCLIYAIIVSHLMVKINSD